MYNEKTMLDKFSVFLTFAFVPLFAFCVVMVIPFIFGIVATLTDWNGTGSEIEFVGFRNYLDAFKDIIFIKSMVLTFKYVLLVLVFTNIIAFLLALLVTSGFRGQNFFRSIYFTPNLIGGVILGFIWQFIFSRVFVFFGKLTNIEILKSSWIGDEKLGFWALVIVGVWQLSGYMMIIYIAGLGSIPNYIIEAAKIDGAKPLTILKKIKIPLIMQSITICSFLTLQKSFMVFDTNLSLTKGGPYRSTELISMHIYYEAFTNTNYGTGQAKSIVFFVIVAVLALAQVAILKKKEVESL
jgi:raffinose/stachyose/melibiose transport system permease protein